MTISPSGPGDRSSRRLLLVGAVVYVVVLISVAATMSLSAGTAAVNFVQEQKDVAPKAPDPIPTLPGVKLPNIIMSNDSAAAPAPRAVDGEAVDEKSTLFVAQFRENDKPYVAARSPSGGLARLGIGDEVDGAVIARIGGGRVTLDAAGKSRTSAIQAEVSAKAQ